MFSIYTAQTSNLQDTIVIEHDLSFGKFTKSRYDLYFCMRHQEVKRMSKGQFQVGRRTLKSCNNKGKTKHVIYVDVENDDSLDFILIDAPECSQKGLRGSDVISIDDDEVNVGDADKGGCDQNGGGTSSRVSCSGFRQGETSNKPSFYNFQCPCGNKTPMTFGKSRRTYSEKRVSRNRFGLGPVSDYTSSDSDSSDCELMEGTSGKIQEEWERAASKRKTSEGVLNGHCGVDEEVSESVSTSDTSRNVDTENITKQNVEIPSCSIYEGTNYEKGTAGDGEDPFFTPEENFVRHRDETVNQGYPSWQRTPLWEDVPISHKNVDIDNEGNRFQGQHPFSSAELQSDEDDNNDETCGLMNESGIHVEPKVTFECFGLGEINLTEEVFWSNNRQMDGTGFNYNETRPANGEECFHSSETSDETRFSKEKVNTPGVDETIHKTTCFSRTPSPKSTHWEREFNCNDKPISGDSSMWNNQPHEKMVADNSPTHSYDSVTSIPEEYFNHTGHIQDNSVIHENVSHHGILSPSSSRNKKQINPEMVFSIDEDGPALRKIDRSPSLAQDANGAHDAKNNVIGEREKLKESDEFKRAAEEEWASRQRELQLQAEEAQRLRKRKKVETQRLLDMERRQKERVEEMRETQKKNVDTNNLKEQLRVEVRKELGRLELIHTDMVSLLRALGIRVGSGVYPTSHEVSAAYKQALLKFHPDRSSRTDIRQQVEAEEKFKLVSGMKEKLNSFVFPSSRYF